MVVQLLHVLAESLRFWVNLKLYYLLVEIMSMLGQYTQAFNAQNNDFLVETLQNFCIDNTF